MKVVNALILTILVFLIIGAVNATENVTIDNLADEKPIVEDVNVTYDEVMWQENLTDIEVELPDDSEGDFSVMIDDEVIYNQTITEKSFKIPIKLPQKRFYVIASIWPPIDYTSYKVSAFYNNINLNLTTPLKVMRFSPDYNYLNFPEEILKNDPHSGMITFPRSANGTVEFYIDDRLINRTHAMPIFSWKENPFSKLSLGNHTFKVVYLGDKYYRPYNKTFNFTVTDVVINIPKTINIGHDDCISVQTLKDVAGTVKVYIDGKLVSTSKSDDNYYVLSLEKFIKYTNTEVKVVFSSKDLTRTKTQKVNFTYDFDVYPYYFTYGEKNILEIMLPDTLDNKLLTVTIDGVKYPFKRSKYIVNNEIEVDVSKLSQGNHLLNVSFAGNDKFYPLSRTYNLTVEYEVICPMDVVYKDQSKLYLKLPKDAKGNLVVTINGKVFKTIKMSNGYAEVRIDSFKPGIYNIGVNYTGNDYNVSDSFYQVYVSPDITVEYKFREGENKYIKAKVPKDCKGYLIVNIDGKNHKVAIKDGVAKYNLKNLKRGEHEIEVGYYGADGFEDIFYYYDVKVLKPKVKLTLKKAKVKRSVKKLVIKSKLKINGKKAKGKVVKFKFNKKTYKVKTNKKGVAKVVIKKNVLKKLKKGKKVTYQATYLKDTVKRTVKVKK